MPPSPPAPPAVATGVVRLIIAEIDPSGLIYMDIPLERIEANTTKPRAYLLYLGAYSTGNMSGFISYDTHPVVNIGRDGSLVDGATYRFVVPGTLNPLGSASIDLEVLAKRSTEATTDRTRERFKEMLMPRDPRCVFTGLSITFCIGQHIIPFARGEEWVQLIVDHRPAEEGDNFGPLDTVNSFKNGLNVAAQLHSAFDMNKIAYIKTPNPFLQPDDVPRSPARELAADVQHPRLSRYTLQWLEQPDSCDLLYIPQNADAAFSTNSNSPKPAAALLHYTYAGAAMLQWGQTNQLLSKEHNKDLPRPSAPPPRQHWPDRTGEEEHWPEDDGEPGDGFTLVTGEYGPIGTGGRPDADQLMALFAYNSPAARARREEWRASVSSWAENVPERSPSDPNL